ncbi:hypothetical protein BS78_02G277800 [Paspalum vaginatum]|nr:hypothetical protein BS78_02G277800 [Paspalum vaginatum]
MPSQGSSRRRRSEDRGDGDGVDRLSGLPEELLLQILGRLGSVHAAVRTSVLSSRWRGLWTGLQELTFRGVAVHSVKAALAKLAGPALNLLEVGVEERVSPRRVSSLLRAAARVAPKNLTVTGVVDYYETGGTGTANLPCLDRTASLKIDMWEMAFAPPPAGEFVALTDLCLVWCRVDPAALLPLCPHLRVLVLKKCCAEKEVIIHSQSLEELELEEYSWENIDIMAPVLKKVKLELSLCDEVNVSFSSPMVEHSDWELVYEDLCVVFGELWRMETVSELLVQGQRPLVRIDLCAKDPDTLDQEWSFEQAIAQFRMPNLYVLELVVTADGHVFGPMLLHLLQIRPAMQRLDIFIEEPDNWVSESVTLTDLQVVEIGGLTGRDHELDFIKLLFRSATVLRRMIVRLSDGVSPDKSRIKKICCIFKEYPNVKCDVYCNGKKWAMVQQRAKLLG